MKSNRITLRVTVVSRYERELFTKSKMCYCGTAVVVTTTGAPKGLSLDLGDGCLFGVEPTRAPKEKSTRSSRDHCQKDCDVH